MPIYDKRDLNNWYNTILEQKKPSLHPFLNKNIDVDSLEENEYKANERLIYAKIPKIQGRIFRRSPSDRNEVYVELLIGTHYDKETQQTRNDKVIIGYDLCDLCPGRMLINDNYHTYFDIKGNLINDPLKQKGEQEAQEKAEKEAAERKAREAAKPKQKETSEKEPKTGGTERTVQEIKESLLEQEKLLNQKLQELKQKERDLDEQLQQLQEAREELDEIMEYRKVEAEERETAYLRLLDSILDNQRDIVREQAKRKPDHLMKLTQIRAINEILAELQHFFASTEAEGYLHLAEEPREDDLENHPGTTYGEMAILLSAYASTINACQMGHLYWKDQSPKIQGNEEDEDGDEE